MDMPAYLSGQLLLALPGIGDPRFERAAIAMCAHDENGALGIGLGDVVDGLSFHDLLAQFEIAPGEVEDRPIHVGGPVEPRRGFILHSPDWGGQDSIDVAGRWALSGSVDVLRAIAEGKGPSRWVAALGYAGWSAGQLDAEMTRHGWLAVEANDALLFDLTAESRWSAGYASAGIDPRLLSPLSGQA
jgi:putative transcriptional regulator